MKKLFLPLLLILASIGCHKNIVQAPVPGQLNTFDAYAFRTLFDLQAALNSFKSDVEAGKVSVGPTAKTVLNQTIQDYDAAQATYKSWHAAGGLGPTKPLTDAIGKTQLDLGNLASQTGGK